MLTFDLFSALLDSRRGGSAAFAELAQHRGWNLSGNDLYDTWDGANKASQKNEDAWASFAEHSRRAMVATYARYHLGASSHAPDDAAQDTAWLLRTVRDWPMWPDVAIGLAELARRYKVGVLSNVDDDIWRTTSVAVLIDDDHALTSQRLHAYKPSPEIYLRAQAQAAGALLHVATSARDVRGALEAGINVIRLRRSGHDLDPEGPQPVWTAQSVSEVARILDGGAFAT